MNNQAWWATAHEAFIRLKNMLSFMLEGGLSEDDEIQCVQRLAEVEEQIRSIKNYINR